ncbi:MAG: hypothetical protein DMG14_19960 [Acidobacteria bacterium]|nr:MAG: hypothetical protein DMG14_19960 [Acidobacteriota bacterium]
MGLGKYEVKAELPGFRTATRKGIQLTVAAEEVVNLTLSVGAVTEQVQVTGEPPLVETTSATLSGLVDDKKIRDLPLNGRSFDQLAFLQPGVTPYFRGRRETDQGEGTKFSVSGSRVDSNSFLLDGTNINDQSNNTPGSASGNLLGVEMLREFRVLTGAYSAEYGRYSGGIITAVSKSGGNKLHGNVYEFLRNDNLDARNFFDRKSKPDDPRLPEFKRNQFGATIGGPIVRDRTFFFGGYEGLRQRKGESRVAVVPNANAHQGILPCPRTRPAAGFTGSQAPCNSAGTSTYTANINPAVKPFLDLYPLPNGADFGDGTAQLFSNPKRPVDEDYTTGRVDHNFSNADSFFVRYTFDRAVQASPTQYPNVAVDAQTKNQYVTLSETRIFSPRVLNTARLGFNRSYSNQFNRPLFDVKPELLFVPGQQLGLITFRGIGITEFGGGQGYPRRFGHNVWQVTDDLTVSRGSHSLKMGMLFERTQSNSTLSRVYGGQFYFDTLDDFFAARAAQFQDDIPGSDSVRGWRQSLFGFYLQDDFQARSNLTLNLGLRYEFTTVPKEVNGKLANFRNPLTDKAPTIGDPWFQGSYKDFGPRVGFSWDPWSNGKTAIRGGFGMYFDHLVAQPLNRALSRVPPFIVTTNVLGAAATFPRLDPSLMKAPPLTEVISYGLQYNMKDPTKIGYNLSIQRQVASQTAVTVAYAGSHSYHQLNGNNGNNALPSEIRNGRKYFAPNSPRRNPNIGQIQFWVTPEGSSQYHSLQVGLNRRFASGLQLQGSYTYAKNTNNADGVFGRYLDISSTVPQDPDDWRSDWGLAGIDIRNYFSFNYTYDLPFARNRTGAAGKFLGGWQMNGILTLADGTPVTITTGFNRSRNGATGQQISDRPDLLPGFSNNPVKGVSKGCPGVPADAKLGTPDMYFDPCAFALPEAGFYGNLGRNTVIGPGLANFDFALVKNISFLEAKSVQFRAEAFNVFNHPNFARPGALTEPIRLFNPSGERVASAATIRNTLTDSRQIQFGLKFTF